MRYMFLYKRYRFNVFSADSEADSQSLDKDRKTRNLRKTCILCLDTGAGLMYVNRFPCLEALWFRGFFVFLNSEYCTHCLKIFKLYHFYSERRNKRRSSADFFGGNK